MVGNEAGKAVSDYEFCLRAGSYRCAGMILIDRDQRHAASLKIIQILCSFSQLSGFSNLNDLQRHRREYEEKGGLPAGNGTTVEDFIRRGCHFR